MKTHGTIVLGWKDDQLVFMKTFDDETERTEMHKAFFFVKKTCDNYIIESIETFKHDNHV
jgi:hypothetical protein